MSDLRFANSCALIGVSPSTLKVIAFSGDISRAEGLSFYHPKFVWSGFAVLCSVVVSPHEGLTGPPREGLLLAPKSDKFRVVKGYPRP